MISCEQFLAELGNYLEDAVVAETKRLLEDHLSRCRTCQVLYDSTRKSISIVTESASFDLPQHLAEPMVERIVAKVRISQPANRQGVKP